jgi:hypothetical protein
MSNCSHGINNEVFVICFRMVIVVLMGPFSGLLFRICSMYADRGSFCFMYLMCVRYLCMWQWLICLTYDSLHVLHVSVNSTHFCSCILLVVLDLVRCCVVLVILKDIPTFVCLNRLVTLRTSGI